MILDGVDHTGLGERGRGLVAFSGLGCRNNQVWLLLLCMMVPTFAVWKCLDSTISAKHLGANARSQFIVGVSSARAAHILHARESAAELPLSSNYARSSGRASPLTALTLLPWHLTKLQCLGNVTVGGEV